MTDICATPIDWQHRMRTRGGKVGHYLGRCEITGKHRLQTSNRHIEIVDNKDVYTTWLLDDFGSARGDRKSCAEDCIGPAPIGGGA